MGLSPGLAEDRLHGNGQRVLQVQQQLLSHSTPGVVLGSFI